MHRRAFLATTAALAAGPRLLGMTDKAGSNNPVVGSGEYAYEVTTHQFGELPSHLQWQTTQAVALDAAGLVYISNQGVGPVMDTIFVFEPGGKFVRSFGREFHGGCHGLDIRKDGTEEFCYVTNTSVPHPKVAKTTLKGEAVWVKDRPAGDEYADAKKPYKPTNTAFLPDGGFVVGDGYGSNYLSTYDAAGKLKQVTGGTGQERGQFRTPHGLWVDPRDPGKPQLVVCDRSNARLQRFALDGGFLGMTDPGTVLHPCNVDTHQGLMVVPDLFARVTLFGPQNQVLAQFGDDAAWRKKVLANGNKLRTQPKEWVAGKFVHPHDAAFDAAGNIIVTEWVVGGRVGVLKKVA